MNKNTMRANKILEFEDADITYRNFRGDDEGKRYFILNVPADAVEGMRADGWNVRQRKEANPDGENTYYIKVNVNTGARPSIIHTISKRNPDPDAVMDAEHYMMLDDAEFDGVDLIIRQKPYDYRGQKGISTVLKEAWFYIHESRLASKARGRRAEVEDDNSDMPF